mmetsp:Transcript_10042/g.27493  ORF Transcript_10042/g.27493 Transcript_10042/m.27493 type:complete len:124 (+) Transcript_10042:398-769(+)
MPDISIHFVTFKWMEQQNFAPLSYSTDVCCLFVCGELLVYYLLLRTRVCVWLVYCYMYFGTMSSILFLAGVLVAAVLFLAAVLVAAVLIIAALIIAVLVAAVLVIAVLLHWLIQAGPQQVVSK